MSESEELEEMKYFFACIEYSEPQYLYMGVHCTTRIYDKDIIVKRSNTFSLDHYPSKQEIINHILPYHEEYGYSGMDIISYNEMSKQQYDAYQ